MTLYSSRVDNIIGIDIVYATVKPRFSIPAIGREVLKTRELIGR